jgi:predicted small metal-binding protein
MKELMCRDVGFDCDGVVTGETEYDVMREAAAHVKEVHGLSDEQVNDPDFGRRVGDQIHAMG